MADMNNLDILTDKIYQEGIEKATKESEEILTKATAEHDRVVRAAQEEAKKIITDAQREAARISRSTEKELQLKGKQLVSDLKEEIQHLLSQKILHKSTNEAFADHSFMQTAILEAIASWKSTDELELLLPKELEHKLEEAFRQSIRAHAKNLFITFSDRLSSGFRIAEKANAYQISFTESDFVALFAPYLEEQTAQLLFSQST
ncbi:V-type ATP synthase subunit E [Tunicatimonas pelagia]|uniref:V-type ATP synthase subunit E n=1 Tax=Tunicatimonas pelagia TaxID=931531 RepID=UPI002665A2C0|nr:V-type ATP synthase subunit E [Tunicatimonas pelagia]WKN45601.1 V-type ATP synthase subunit E [Tunicatimonas pelagia]